MERNKRNPWTDHQRQCENQVWRKTENPGGIFRDDLIFLKKLPEVPIGLKNAGAHPVLHSRFYFSNNADTKRRQYRNKQYLGEKNEYGHNKILSGSPPKERNKSNKNVGKIQVDIPTLNPSSPRCHERQHPMSRSVKSLSVWVADFRPDLLELDEISHVLIVIFRRSLFRRAKQASEN